MTYPKHLGELSIEQDAAILKTLLDISDAFVMTDPLYTYTLLPYATNAYEIGSATEYYKEGWFLNVHIGDNPAYYQGTIYGRGIGLTKPDICVYVNSPSASAVGNYSAFELITASFAGNEDAYVRVRSGDENAGYDAFIELTTETAGDGITARFDLDGLLLEGPMRLIELSTDPTAPIEGRMVMWQSDGTGAGDDGDIMMSIRAGGATKTITLVDFSAF